MKDQIHAHTVISPELFKEFVSLSGLTEPDMIIRLSQKEIMRRVDSCDCLSTNALSAIQKYDGLSGDVYITRVEDKIGNPVIAIDVVRPDRDKKTENYVMDQEPIYIRYTSENNLERDAWKITHLDCNGRTFALSDYEDLSSHLERDRPVHRSELSSMDPGIFNAILNGVNKVFP